MKIRSPLFKKELFIFTGLLAVMALSPLKASAMQVFVRPPQAASLIVLEVEPSDSVENVKAKIQDKRGYSPEEQRLVYNSVRMEDGRTLSDYNVPSGSTIDLVVLEGGVANFTFTVTNSSGGECAWARYFLSCSITEVSAVPKLIYFDSFTINDLRLGGQLGGASTSRRVQNLVSMGQFELARNLLASGAFLQVAEAQQLISFLQLYIADMLK